MIFFPNLQRIRAMRNNVDIKVNVLSKLTNQLPAFAPRVATLQKDSIQFAAAINTPFLICANSRNTLV